MGFDWANKGVEAGSTKPLEAEFEPISAHFRTSLHTLDIYAQAS